MELHEEPYTLFDLWWIVNKVFTNASLITIRGQKHYINVACAFDIEVSSFYDYEEKRATMYVWMLGLGGYCIIGRTWDEFITAKKLLVTYLGLDANIRLPIYVHNLSYEFQFIKDMFEWDAVFAIDERKPNYCRTTDGIEFRCSYQLSGYNLAMVGKNLQKYKVKKMVGDLDYSLIRHSKTPLTKEEIGYCVHDVLVVMAYIQECIDIEGDVTKIPNTKTGYVRRATKQKCMGTGHGKKRNWMYRDMIHGLTLEPDEYLQLRRAFQGGFTHASVLHSGITLNDVDSYDFTSSYPAVMLSEKFPMSCSKKAVIEDRETLDYYLKNYCCLFDISFKNLLPKEIFEDYISISRSRNYHNPVVNNGRVVSADYLTTTVTEQDFMIIDRLYNWDAIAIDNFRYYKKQYLPREFVSSILDFYEAKTTLKDVEGKEVEYMQGKANLNSLYGMIVTDIIRDSITYRDGEWQSDKSDLEIAIDKYNKGYSRFLYYPWGVWVTAYARKNLWTGILTCKTDYVYSDTDSLKILNGDKYKWYIDDYNETITEMIREAMEYQQIDMKRTRPKTIYGVEKPIGVWDYEGHYKKFKTLGAKRYLWQKEDGETQMTVAGLGKKTGLKYLQFAEMSGKSLFDKFSDDMYIPREWTGKNIHTYIDFPTEGYVTDYLGSTQEYHELSSIHMEPTDYSLSIGAEYANYLLHVQTKSD